MENETRASTRTESDFVNVSRKRLLRNFLVCGLTCVVIGHGLGNGWLSRGIEQVIDFVGPEFNQPNKENYIEYSQSQPDYRNLQNLQYNKEK